MRITYIFLEIQRKQQTKWMNRTYDIKASSEFFLYWVCFSFVFTMKKKRNRNRMLFRRSLFFTFVISDFCSSTVFFSPRTGVFFFLVCCGLLLSYPLDDFLCWFSIVNYWIRFLFCDIAQEKHSFEKKKRWTILFWFNFHRDQYMHIYLCM